MPVIDAVAQETVGLPGIPGMVVGRVREEFSRLFWIWFYVNREDVVFQRRVAFWTLKVTLQDLRPVFVKVFGEDKG